MGDDGISRMAPTSAVSQARGPRAPKADFVEAIFEDRERHPAFQALAREKVTVLATETYFPPVAVGSPVDQIIHRIATDLGTAIPQADPKQPPDSAGERGELRQTSATCIRSLTLQLEPASLGPVTIRLRLSGTTLGLEIEAEDLETTRLIGRGRQTLTEKLRVLGLSVDTFVVSDARGRGR